MDVTSSQPVQTGSTTPSPAASTGASKSALSSDFETFLKMLTTQMQYQDPMNPMKSNEFATQLATFSSVEQQTRTNELLTSMATQLGVMGMSQLASWVGMQARTDAPVRVDGRAVEFSPNPAAAADRMAIVVKDTQGNQVGRLETAASREPLSWTPTRVDGQPLPAGTYTFELESLSGGDVLKSEPMETYAPIVEAMNAGGEVKLVLEGGVTVLPSDISALRRADA